MNAVSQGVADARLLRTLAGPALLALGIVIATLLTDTGYASYASYRISPQITLSDGTTLVLTTVVSDTPSDLRSATYTLQVPRGVVPRAIGYDRYGTLEHIHVLNNRTRSRSYRLTVTVRTGTEALDVRADVHTRGGPCRGAAAQPHGKTGFLLWAVISCP